MRTSDSLDLLAAALVKAQLEMPVAKRSSDNPFFKSKYADLEEIRNISLPVLNKYGLSIVQGFEPCEGPQVMVSTMLLHVSGQFIEGTMALTPAKSDPQGQTAAGSYGRRTGWSAIGGIVTQGEDDDGNQASTSPSRGRQAAPRGPTRQGIAKAAPGWAEEPPPITEDRPERPPDPYGATEPQKKMIWKLITDLGLTTTKGEDAIGGHTILHWGGQTIILNDLTKREASELIEEILNAPK